MNNNSTTSKAGIVGSMALSIFIVFSMIACAFCAKRIPTGYEGVVFSMNGGVQGNTIREG